MTPAVRAASRAGIRYSLHEYRHDPGANAYGPEAAAALGVDPNRVFKTLVVSLSGSTAPLAIALVPVPLQLDLKAFAAAAHAKKAAMADVKTAERATGFVVGGISPLGQRRRFPTIVDISVLGHPTVFVSAGKRGLQLELAPDDLIRLCAAATAPIGLR